MRGLNCSHLANMITALQLPDLLSFNNDRYVPRYQEIYVVVFAAFFDEHVSGLEFNKFSSRGNCLRNVGIATVELAF
ncbi:hypothetical protein AGR3A_Cc190134 [Agrobacterium tomkonis CFBP 6623]|uniref:Uncharacterized protein n=1 Tax=Agrobacterium tomkonis CFBP 6623 TaxID=1183432 RepID=A0A1S7P255_9HYPH|nr:hypothetical protein AGR3A_Cc190134 [Agrobacterium tomkonis CFBP 6623]